MLKKILLFLLGFILLSCTSTRITSEWTTEVPGSVASGKILILGLVRDSNRALRENMEKHLTEDLSERGYDVISSYKEFGPKTFEGLSESAALEQLRNNNIDLVLTVVLLDKERERYYYHGYFYYSPFFYYYNNFWGYQMMMNSRIYQPGYYVTDTRYFWESNLYDLRNKKLLWSVQTQSFDPSSTEQMAHEYGEKISENLQMSGILRISR
jgi:hypothetical protein